MRVLCVAEKPSISKSISQILSGGRFTTQNTRSPYIKNYEFTYPQTNSHYVVTCVTGHLMSSDFDEAHRKWNSCDAFDLFDATVETVVASDNKAIEENLLTQARRADTLMIWTDCDREGEHIGMEIVTVCRRAKRNIQVKRARFSAIIAQQIHNAAQHPVEIDHAQADAVEARIILDLKVGAAFTRLQTLALQARVAQLAEGKNVVSYGPCQFPTLGFVVNKWKLVQDFVPETFWYIYLSLIRETSGDEQEETKFNWRRGHLFDQDVANAIYELVLSNPVARVVKVTNKNTKKWKPLPLTTVELQKAGSRLLKLAPKTVLDIAERLYQQGFVSYPRTETDQFDPQFDFQNLIDKQTVDPAWGAFATSLGQGGFAPPRKGKNNDQAHPPIHPTAHANNLSGDQKRVYEFITRRFLACCSKDAEGWQTTVEVECGGEAFQATGLVVLERNYLDVYTYDKWVGHIIPEFQEGEQFNPSVCELREGQTSKPNPLTEADLVTLMDKNGIGTDATIAQHIQTIIDRDYVIERMEGSIKYLIPSKLGIALVEGYEEVELNRSLTRPQLRRETERNMVQVCNRTKSKNDMLQEAIAQYKEMFIIARREFDKVVSSVRKYLERNGDDRNGGDGGGPGGGSNDDGPDDDDDDDTSRRRNPTSARGRGGRGGKGAARPAPIDIDSDDDNYGERPQRRKRGATTKAESSKKGRSTTTKASKAGKAKQQNPSNEVLCDCQVPANQLTVRKETASKGKLFWTCGNGGACSFFQWVDNPPAFGNESSSRPLPVKRSYSESQGSQGPNPVCKCGNPAVNRTVTKANDNQGRKFWGCSNGPNAGCGFFEWADGPPPSQTGGSSSKSGTLANDFSAPSGECFKCNQPGHWANACPNSNLNSSRSFGSTSSTSQICYKCNQEGHFSSACPNASRNFNSTPLNRGGTSGACYKCGQEGHWSNACQNDGMQRGSLSRRDTSSSRGRASTTKSKRGRAGKRKSAFGPP